MPFKFLCRQERQSAYCAVSFMSPHEMSNVQNQYNTDDFNWITWLKIFVTTQLTAEYYHIGDARFPFQYS